MGKLHFTQINNLPPNVSDHGILNVYNKDEIELLTVLKSAGYDLSDRTDSGVLSTSTAYIETYLEEECYEPYVLFIDGVYVPSDEHSLVAPDGEGYVEIVKESGQWAAGSTYTYMIMELIDLNGKYTYSNFIVDTKDISSDRSSIGCPSDLVVSIDSLHLFINGVHQELNTDYTINSMGYIIKSNGNFLAGDQVTTVVVKVFQRISMKSEDIYVGNSENGHVNLNDWLDDNNTTDYEHPATHPVSMITDAMSTTEIDTAITDAITNLIDSSPANLDTLSELAAALGDDNDFATTITNMITENTDRVIGDENNFNSTTGIVITHGLDTTDYSVNITPIGDPGGFLGEVWVVKNAMDMEVYCSGTYTGAFSWMILKW